MNTCLNCQKETHNPKFCSRSCAAIINNMSHPKRLPEGNCKVCYKPVQKSRLKFCRECRQLGLDKKPKQSFVSVTKTKEKNSETFRTYALKRSREDIGEIFKKSSSFAEVLRLLSLKVSGGNYKMLHRYINRYSIDCSHMTGQNINANRVIKSFDGLTSNHAIKKRLVLERGYCCERCKLDLWLELPICLELEHINGNNLDNRKENLLLLCPNCHSQTPTWRNRKRK